MKLMIQIPTDFAAVEAFVSGMEKQGYKAHRDGPHGYFSLDGKTVIGYSYTIFHPEHIDEGRPCFFIGIRPE